MIRIALLFWLSLSSVWAAEENKLFYSFLSAGPSSALAADSILNSIGAGWGIEAGITPTPNFMVGLRFHESATVGGFILVGNFLGVNARWRILGDEHFNWKIGAGLGYGNFAGLFIFPIVGGSYSSLLGGPNTMVEWRLNPFLSLIGEFSVWGIPSGIVKSSGLAPDTTSIGQSFWLNASIGLCVRF